MDGFRRVGAGALMVGEPGFKACTPYGCMKMLESLGMADLRGKACRRDRAQQHRRQAHGP